MSGPTIHSVVMDERTTDLFQMIEREVKRGLLTFQMPLVAGIEEAVRQAYVRGVRDGFQQGALAAVSPVPAEKETELSAYATWDANLHLASDEPDGYPDVRMVPVVEALRARGIVTYQSCQGHPGTDDGCLWAAFDLTEEQARSLAASGVFTHVKRMFLPVDCWEFVWPPERFEDAVALLVPAESLEGAWGEPPLATVYDNVTGAVVWQGDALLVNGQWSVAIPPAAGDYRFSIEGVTAPATPGASRG